MCWAFEILTGQQGNQASNLLAFFRWLELKLDKLANFLVELKLVRIHYSGFWQVCLVMKHCQQAGVFLVSPVFRYNRNFKARFLKEPVWKHCLLVPFELWLHMQYTIYYLVAKFSFLKFDWAAYVYNLLDVEIQVLLEVEGLIWDLLNMLGYCYQGVYARP